jgi:hypothetical protein
MSRFVYLLAFLLISTQVDDIWAAGFDVPSSLADENNDYLPSLLHSRGERPSSSQKLVIDRLKPPTVNFSLAQRGGSSERNLTTPFTSPPLYDFMSLQL